MGDQAEVLTNALNRRSRSWVATSNKLSRSVIAGASEFRGVSLSLLLFRSSRLVALVLWFLILSEIRVSFLDAFGVALGAFLGVLRRSV